jgi:hypothetical protein
MEVEIEEKQRWVYTLPDGSKATNMKEAKIKLGVSKTRLIGMLKSGVVKRIEVYNSKSLEGYGNTKTFTD